ncbi:MAG: hypothetical protein NTV34_21840 [Proteobacteria bacterium]|nr:hypothetical protein [Pseudomonadota bacterium]
MNLIRKVEGVDSSQTVSDLLLKVAKDQNLTGSTRPPAAIGMTLTSKAKEDMLQIIRAYQKYVYDNITVVE